MSSVRTGPPRRGLPIGLVVLLLVIVAAIGAIFYGAANRPDFDVFYFDAGPFDSYEVGEPRYFPQARIFVISLDEEPVEGLGQVRRDECAQAGAAQGGSTDGPNLAKELRALDAISPSGTGCVIEFVPDDPRGTVLNPLGKPGVYVDHCSQAVWYLNGDALARTTQALHAFQITRPLPINPQCERIVEVEVIGRPNLAEAERER